MHVPLLRTLRRRRFNRRQHVEGRIFYAFVHTEMEEIGFRYHSETAETLVVDTGSNCDKVERRHKYV